MKMFFFLFPITLFLMFLCMKLVLPDVYISLIREDSVIEWMQVVFYLISSIIALLVSIKSLRHKMTLNGVLYGILAIGLLFISLEEVSWGQRIIHIATPDYFRQHNVQHEISLHNLRAVQPIVHGIYMLVGFYGAFAWIFLYLFTQKAKTRYHHIVNFVVPDWFLSSYFFFTFFIYTLLGLVRPHPGDFLVWQDQEPMELLLSLGFLSFAAFNYVRLRKYLSASSGCALFLSLMLAFKP
jgi:hypothetical protein